MSWTKEVTLWCDGEDCYRWERPGDSHVGDVRDFLSEWVYRDGKDLCPDCKEDR